MGITDFQDFLENNCSSACVSVDLLKIARGFVPKRRVRYSGSGRFCLVVDAESCLDRLYGGFFSDWVCGGQWNRMTAFLTSLIQACHNANMELVIFFNGCLESQKLPDWLAEQMNQKEKVRSVLRHISNKGTPPPKVWWSHPVFLTGALKMALRHLGVSVACSMDDHHQEVIGFCREHNLQGIIAQESVYTIFDPPRYFSSNNLKLTYKGSLETKEYIMDEIAKCLNLNPNRFCIFAALLGNHILSDDDLRDFRSNLPPLPNGNQHTKRRDAKLDAATIKATVDFVRNLPATDNLDSVGEIVFKTVRNNKPELIQRFKQSVQYYLNGTQEGFLKYRPRLNIPGSPRQPGGYPGPINGHAGQMQETSGYGDPLNPAPHIVIDPPHRNAVGTYGLESSMQNLHLDPADKRSATSSSSGSSPSRHSPDQSWPKGSSDQKNLDAKAPSISPEIMRVASERHQKGLMAPWVYQLLSLCEIKLPVILEDDTNRELPSYIDLFRPIRQTVYSVLFNLNKLKIMHDNQNKERGDNAPRSFDVLVKEWVVRRGTNKPVFEVVIAKPVDWKTPSIERMWLGQQPDDKNRRLRAFLTCMQSDSPLMLNTQYIPQHLLIMCCVLRYILRFGRVLQRQELDAFLAMSVSPLLHDVQTMQDLKLPTIQTRGAQLAALFMAGVETAIFTNDVCGAPIPWTMCCPWLFFDGKLFHFKLLKANNNTPLIDMCDGQVDQVMRVERMRQAIMENISVEFAKPLLPTASLYSNYPYGPYPVPPGVSYRPAGAARMAYPIPVRGGRGGPPVPVGMGPKTPGRGRGILGRSPVDQRGGQLEVAGVVVGSWGPNYSAAERGRGGHPGQGGPPGHNGMPQVMSMGRRGMGPSRGFLASRGMRGRLPPMYSLRGGMRPTYTRGRGIRAIRRPTPMRPRQKMTTTRSRPTFKTTITSKGRGVTVDASASGLPFVSQDVRVTEGKVGIFSDADEAAVGAINHAEQDSGFIGDGASSALSV
ncbi:constitutive coactivator of PPAR-gamma-like protein 1 isoform X2 [Gigantopelta aegis]|uniref:constitutive coactivator of PPAR-gamma-like protein 1 isoform X2 n=1 Tax=Gigantopelta aegis TaxID=1735272 RepID=UPI001B888997|nr:constitutive coactivator of PPAR-gamma-like protein 1 isoform X2 [Gigantopelta aegis]